MKIKLKNKENHIPPNSMWCFSYSGYDSEIIKKLNSGESVDADKIPKPAQEYVKQIKSNKEKK